LELFFNLVWVALSVTLFGLWVRDRRNQDPSHQGRNPSRARLIWQLTALAVLIVVLLPAVSLTDDLQACTAPAETEHIGRRISIQHFIDGHANPLPLACFALHLFALVPAPRVWAFLPGESSGPRALRGSHTANSIRPPPTLA
jgi:hypothetical protein